MPNISNISEYFTQWKSNQPSRSKMSRVFDTTDLKKSQNLLREWKAAQLTDKVDWPESRKVHIALCGFTTLNYLEPHVYYAALAEGFSPKVTLGSYNQLFQDLTSPDSPITEPTITLLWIWAELEDLLPDQIVRKADQLLSAQGIQAIDNAVDMFVSALSIARKQCNGYFLVNDFSPTRRSPFGIFDSSREVSYEQIYNHANEKLKNSLLKISSCSIFPLRYHLSNYGLSRAIDPRLRLLADCLLTPEFFFEIGQAIRPYIRSLKAAIRKVLVLDLDNTLWGGVVGEDGWENVKIGTDTIGKAFTLFQSSILELYHRGVILAINSKNNFDDVKEIFTNREEMILKLDHFASIQANWQDKATNCHAIAQEINIGLDSLVFWDDNPAERLFLRETLEDVYVVEPPSDPSLWSRMLNNSDLFDTLQLSKEDARRGQMYAEDRIRRDVGQKMPDFQSFLDLLDLKVSCQSITEKNISRIISLLNRTNQFNLTTRRHSEQHVRMLMKKPDWNIMCFSAQDRFGSYGIIGLSIVRIFSDYAELDSFVLSCRAMGKGIEDTMLAITLSQARQMGLKNLKAIYLPTKKNLPIKDYFPSKGFTLVSSTQQAVEYTLELHNKDVVIPKHVTVKYLD